MKWRVVGLETHPASLNMAIDEAVEESVRTGASLPTIRFYRWRPSAVSIGCFQSLDDEVDIKKCKELGVEWVRRRTGGGAVYHDYEGEITYSVIAPEHLLPKDITKSYRVICGWMVDALSRLGIQSEFKPINDIITGGKKISGNAQTRRAGILLQHGTLLYDLDVKRMFSVLRVSADKISDKMIKSVEDRVTSIQIIDRDIGLEQTYKALLEGFTQGKEFSLGAWSPEEMERAEELVESRYASDEWNFSR